ncbi:MAG: hypothetical protein HY096_09755 [Nitrospinae bacterium]|nr:hypothetical protein [Nitrospinota bacterium]
MTGLYFVFKYWRYIVSSVAALFVGFVIAWHIQGIRIEYGKAHSSRLEVKIEKLEADLKGCGEANTTNLTTIKNLQNEIKNAQSLCSSRLKEKEKVIKRLRKIDSLRESVESQKSTENVKKGKSSPSPQSPPIKGGEVISKEFEEVNQEIDGEKDSDIADDPILFELNRMFDTAGDQD